MEIIKCSDFINEARTNKSDVIEALKDVFIKKPKVTMDTMPDEKGLYSIAGMKKALSEFKPTDVSNALFALKDDKKVQIDTVYVMNSKRKEKIPYWYMDLTKAEAETLKEKYEEEEKKKNKVADVPAKKVVVKKDPVKQATKGADKKPGSPVKSSRARKK